MVVQLCSLPAWAQTLSVHGKITSRSTGEPLAGATVGIKGSTTATITDNNGNFTIAVPRAGTVLVITSLGMRTNEYTVNESGEVSIQLETGETNTLNDVVVVGYGTQKKSVVTGAISSVKASDLENMPIMRIEQALQGRTSGLTIAAASGQPGSSATVRVRGTTSINNSDPLYVVDGIPMDGGIDNINQSDIESIEVLKDAASAAIYGARAASGVILVTTKKGKSGNLQFNYNGYYGTQAPARKLKLLNAEEYATLRNESSVAGGGAILFADPKSLGAGTDWQGQIFNNDARIQNHEISLSGGNARSTFYSSFGYFEQDGIVASNISNYKRMTFRLNSTHKVKDWLTIGNNLTYSHIKSRGIGNTNSEFGGILSSAINLDPITPVVITDPNIANAPPYSNHSVVVDALGRPYGISNYVQNEMTNPLAYIQTHQGNYDWSDNMLGNIYAEIEPIKGLKIRSNLGGKLAYWGSDNFTPMAYLNATNSTAKASFSRSDNRGINYNFENTASYQRAFGDHNITVLVGTGAYAENRTKGHTATYDSLPGNITNFTDAASMNYSIVSTATRSSGYQGTEHRVSSLFGRIIYNYADKYLLTAILRRDGSSRFGSNNKYGYFPSVSVGWVASREAFWPTNEIVNFLKVRGSYGVTGNDNIGDFQYVSTVGGGRNYTFGTDNYVIGFSSNAPANPDLKWEQTSQLDLGFEATLCRHFTLVVDWYNKKTTGMLRPIILPAYAGTNGNPTGNVAAMTNKGFEVELGYSQQINEVQIGLKGNVSYLKNEITNLGTVKYITGASLQSSTYELTRMQIGHPIGAFYGFQTAGIFQNQSEVDNYVSKSGKKIQPNAAPGDFRFVDIDGDGDIDADDRTFIGDPTPRWSYGFTANASWNNFDLVVFAQGVAGNDVFNGLRRLDLTAANWTKAALGRWTGEGTSNDFPRLISTDPNKNFSSPSPFYLTKGAYFRLKTIQIGYTIPKSILDFAHLQRVRVYVSSNNLFTATKYPGFDPEIGGSSYGIDRGYYPQARSFMVGLNLSL
jgi:TonB-linked SusC/RagA family outer membrane protein